MICSWVVSIRSFSLRTMHRVLRRGRAEIATARVCCERNALALIGRRAFHGGGRILCYHSLGQPTWGVNDVSPTRFRRHLELALAAGYHFVPAKEIAAGAADPKALALTFDDGLRSVATVAAPWLAEYKIPWSLFVVSGWTDRKEGWAEDAILGWRDLEKLVASGADIGSHSVTHPDFATLEQGRVLDELGQSRRAIEDRLGITVTSFAVPFGQSKNWPAVASSAAREVGYTTVYAQAEDTRPYGTVPRTFVTRFDSDRVFRALLDGAFDRWEEWF